MPTQRVLRILTFISKQAVECTLSEIAEELEIPKSTVSPILKTLVEEKFLKQNVDSLKYKIGISSFMVGNQFLDNLDALSIIKSHMQTIVNECNEICQLGTLNKDKVVYIAKVDPAQPIRLESSVGKALPAHCTALGKVLLSSMQNKAIKELYKNGFEKLTSKSICDVELLLSQIEEIRKTNFAFESKESNQEVECLATGIYKNEKLVCSISVSIPVFRSSKTLINKIKTCLIREAEIISKKIQNIDIDFTK